MKKLEKFSDLDPRWAHFCLDIERETERLTGRRLAEQSFVVAFSGGLDSTALLLAFYALSLKTGCKVCATHLDHSFRPESKCEAVQAKQFADNLGVSCPMGLVTLDFIPGEKGQGLEEKGRKARYAFLEEQRAALNADLILIAHHAEDLAEDMLLRRIRGAGWPELGGMPMYDPKRKILRPFLHTARSTLEAFASSLDATWIVDDVNWDLGYRRNRLRHEVIPLLKRENPKFSENATRIHDLAVLDKEWIEQAMKWNETAEVTQDAVFLPRAKLESKHPALRLRLYKRALEQLGDGQALLENLFNLDKSFAEKRTGSVIQFPGPKAARVVRNGIRFVRGRK